MTLVLIVLRRQGRNCEVMKYRIRVEGYWVRHIVCHWEEGSWLIHAYIIITKLAYKPQNQEKQNKLYLYTIHVLYKSFGFIFTP